MNVNINGNNINKNISEKGSNSEGYTSYNMATNMGIAGMSGIAGKNGNLGMAASDSPSIARGIGNQSNFENVHIGKTMSISHKSSNYNKDNSVAGEKKIGYDANSKEDKNIVDTDKKVAMVNDAIESLKNIITPEGYSQASELGIIPDEDEPENFVGVYERIQIELATYCENYDATGLNVNKEKIKEVVGSEGFANAVDKAMNLYDMSDEAKKSVVESEKPLSVDDASLDSSGRIIGSYNSSKAYENYEKLSENDFENIKDQIDRIIKKAGFDVNEKNTNISKWMVSNGILINEDTITKAIKLEDILSLSKEEFSDVVKKNITYSMYFSGNTASAMLDKNQYDLNIIDKALEVINNVSENDISTLVSNGEEVNIKNLTEIHLNASNEAIEKNGLINESKNNYVHEANSLVISRYTSVIIEARAVMSRGSLLHMSHLGIDINLTELGRLVDKVKENEQNVALQIIKSTNAGLENAQMNHENVTMFSQSVTAIYEMSRAHVGFVGTLDIKVESSEVNVTSTLSEAAQIARNYQSMTDTYEAVGTKVRTDLGDSISKAFSNIDELLNEIDYEANESNRRAARILGYNNMEINSENIDKVKDAVIEVDYLIKNLTPKTVAYLIKNNINPLKKEISELNKELEALNNEIEANNDETYAQFLWKLDKSAEITDEEKQKYIDFYKILKNIKNKDARAVGTAINNNYEFTLENLYISSKNLKVSGKIDKLADSITKSIDVKILTSIFNDENADNISIEKIQDIVESNKSESETYRYFEEKTRELISKFENVDDEEIRYLVEKNIAPTANNILNFKRLNAGNKSFNELLGEDKLDALLSMFEEDDEIMEDREISKDESDENSKDVSSETGSSTLSQKIIGAFNSIENVIDETGILKTLSEFAKRDTYFVPVKTNAGIVNLNLTVSSDDGGSRFSITIKESTVGKIDADFMMREDGVNGIIVYEDEAAKNIMESFGTAFRAAVEDVSIMVKNISVVHSEKYATARLKDEANLVDKETAFRCLKIFINTCKYSGVFS